MTWVRPAVVAPPLVLLLAAAASAQMFVPAGKDTLRGLPGVEVLVEELEPGIASSGLTAAAIAAEVKKQLASSSITVYPSQMQNPSPAKAYLYVHISGFPLQQQGCLLNLQVQVRQTLRSPVTNSNVVNAMTWDRQQFLFMPASNARSSLQAELRTLVQEFVQDWRTTR
jgi:hypothetical protein